MQLFSIFIQLGIMKIYTLFFHGVLFDWLNVWMHLSARLWVSCFMPYLSFIFKESLSFFPITQTSGLRGEHKLMLLWLITWSPATLQASCIMAARGSISVPVSAHMYSVEEEGFADQRGLAIKRWEMAGLCRSTKEKPQAYPAVVIPAGQGYVSHTGRYRYMSASSANRIAHSHCFT